MVEKVIYWIKMVENTSDYASGLLKIHFFWALKRVLDPLFLGLQFAHGLLFVKVLSPSLSTFE